MKRPNQANSVPNNGARTALPMEDMVASTAISHVYIGHSPCLPVMISEEGDNARKVQKPHIITTNLPERVPILPEEIALIRGYMGDLVSRILANDNEPT